MTIDFNYKRIADSVHGTVPLSKLEIELINTKSFQRLRNICHLGLVPLVFPGANYSRLSHSIGTCHLVGLILNNINKNCKRNKIEPYDLQKYRLAGLLHDIGHYPFSHAMEQAIGEVYVGRKYIQKKKNSKNQRIDFNEKPFLKHDAVSKEIIERDSQIKKILKNSGYNPEDISKIFMGQNPESLTNLICSDLDADRIDYLLRTSHHTGLPFGSVDLDYLLNQITLDSKNKLCLSKKALRTADHFLLCRYFDYMQVTFNKAVVGLELVLKDLIVYFLKNEKDFNCSGSDVIEKITNETWCKFDDIMMFDLFRKIKTKTKSIAIKRKIDAIIHRQPPKMVFQKEFLHERGKFTEEHKNLLEGTLNENIKIWAKKHKIQKDDWYLWTNNGIKITKIGSHMTYTEALTAEEEKLEEMKQSIQIKEGKKTIIISETESSLMRILSNHVLYSIRIYVITTDEKRKAIEKDITETLKKQKIDT